MRTDSPTPPDSAAARWHGGLARARRLAQRVSAGWDATAPARWGAGLGRSLPLGAAGGRRPVLLGLGLAAVGAAVLAALLYAASLAGPTQATAYVRSGERFSRDDLEAIKRALGAKHVAYRMDDQGRVQVAADLVDTADEAVAKLDIGHRSLPEIQRQGLESSLLDTPATKEQRQEQVQLRLLEEMIRRISGITGATVKINRPRPRLGQRGGSPATALVYLETEGDRELSDSTVQAIIRFVADFDSDVHPDAVSIYDRKFQHYALAHDPAASARARDRARSEEFRRDIAKEIDWIKGVQVSVRLMPAANGAPLPLPALPATTAAAPNANAGATPSSSPTSAPPQATVAASASVPMPAPTSGLPPLPVEPPPAPPAEELGRGARPGAPAVAANQPLDIDATGPEPGAEAATEPLPVRLLPTPVPTVLLPPSPSPAVAASNTAPNPAAAPAPATVGTPPAAPASGGAAPTAPPPPSLAQVLVKVPRSYYLKIAPKRDPSLEDLHPLMTRVEGQIETAVRHVIPTDQFGRVNITTIADEMPAPEPPPSAVDARRAAPGWLYAAAGAGAGGALIAALFRLAAGRRPAAPRVNARADRGRYKIDEAPDAAAGPGPSERVRELIRTNPEAAASVLHRWTGQGGPSA